jgi:hypothetical protein
VLGALAGLDDDEPGGARLGLGSCAGSVGSVLPGTCTVGSWAGPTFGAAFTEGSWTESPPPGGAVATTILPTHSLCALSAMPYCFAALSFSVMPAPGARQSRFTAYADQVKLYVPACGKLTHRFFWLELQVTLAPRERRRQVQHDLVARRATQHPAQHVAEREATRVQTWVGTLAGLRSTASPGWMPTVLPPAGELVVTTPDRASCALTVVEASAGPAVRTAPTATPSPTAPASQPAIPERPVCMQHSWGDC